MKLLAHEIKVYVTQDIPLEKAMQQQCALIDTCFDNNPVWLKWHQTNQFKNYSFGGLVPVELNRVYREGNIYSFIIRTFDEAFSHLLQNVLQNAYTPFLKVLSVRTKELGQTHLDKIYTLTPCVLKTEQGYWRPSMSLDTFEKRLTENLIKKYNQLTDSTLDEDFQFFSHVQFDNYKPIATPYKDIELLGDKVTLMLESNQSAQNLARIALGCGLLEVGSRGFGFCGYQFT